MPGARRTARRLSQAPHGGECVTAGGSADGRCGVTAWRQRPAPCAPSAEAAGQAAAPRRRYSPRSRPPSAWHLPDRPAHFPAYWPRPLHEPDWSRTARRAEGVPLKLRRELSQVKIAKIRPPRSQDYIGSASCRIGAHKKGIRTVSDWVGPGAGSTGCARCLACSFGCATAVHLTVAHWIAWWHRRHASKLTRPDRGYWRAGRGPMPVTELRDRSRSGVTRIVGSTSRDDDRRLRADGRPHNVQVPGGDWQW